MRGILISLGLLVLVADCVAGCGGSPTSTVTPTGRASATPDAQRYVSYRNLRYHFAVTYDSTRYAAVVGGKAARGPGTNFSLFIIQRDPPSTSDPANIASLVVSVAVKERPSYMDHTASAVRAVYTMGISQARKFATTVDGNPKTMPWAVELAGQWGFRFDMAGTANGAKRHWQYCEVFAPHAVHTFTLSAPRADWVTRRPDLAAIVLSFKLVK
jgi:hypothetical protein